MQKHWCGAHHPVVTCDIVDCEVCWSVVCGMPYRLPSMPGKTSRSQLKRTVTSVPTGIPTTCIVSTLQPPTCARCDGHTHNKLLTHFEFSHWRIIHTRSGVVHYHSTCLVDTNNLWSW